MSYFTDDVLRMGHIVPKGVQGKWTEGVDLKYKIKINVSVRYAFFGRTDSKSCLCKRTKQ